MRLWITGFGPFPGAPVNPTERLVERLLSLGPAVLGATALHADVLPTEFSRAPDLAAEGHSRLKPDIAVHFGFAAAARAIRLEQRAVNVVEAGRPDATGAFAGVAYVEEQGARHFRRPWPDAVIAALTAAGLPVELSDDAGRYVCNAVFYRSLAAAAARPGAQAFFVHVPHTHDSAAASGAAEGGRLAADELHAGAVALIAALLAGSRTGQPPSAISASAARSTFAPQTSTPTRSPGSGR